MPIPGPESIIRAVPSPALTAEETTTIEVALARPWTDEELQRGRFVIAVEGAPARGSSQQSAQRRVTAVLMEAGWDVIVLPSMQMDGRVDLAVRPPTGR